jgi:membrane protein involved in colicin uptake
MLSTQYRLRLEAICNKIALHEEVSLEDMIWAEKLAKANQTAAKFLRQARRKAENPDMQEGDLDDFLNQLDIGGLGHERFGKTGFNSVDEIVDWFSRDDEDGDWRKRD